jgi:hypothetical protein
VWGAPRGARGRLEELRAARAEELGVAPGRTAEREGGCRRASGPDKLLTA